MKMKNLSINPVIYYAGILLWGFAGFNIGKATATNNYGKRVDSLTVTVRNNMLSKEILLVPGAGMARYFDLTDSSGNVRIDLKSNGRIHATFRNNKWVVLNTDSALNSAVSLVWLYAKIYSDCENDKDKLNFENCSKHQTRF